MLAYYPGWLLTTTDPLNRTTTLTYDSAGNVATSKDALNRIITFEYDAKNRLKKVIDPLLGETVYTYDANGNLLTVKDGTPRTKPPPLPTTIATGCCPRPIPWARRRPTSTMATII
jgi:YD repeat-containing protein